MGKSATGFFLKYRKYASLGILALCVCAALVFRRFVYIEYYPVAMSALVAAAFALSLPGKPLAQVAAEKMLRGVLPDGAEAYCRKLTLFWCAALTANGLVALATTFAPRWVWVAWNCALSYAVLWGLAGAETLWRRRKFQKVFHTSGSTAQPKRIVKTFDTLAKEVAHHRDVFRAEGIVAEADAPHTTFLATIDPAHMYGILWRVLLPRALGCAVDPEIILTPESLLAKMRAAERVVLVTTPSFLAHFAKYAAGYEVPQNCVEVVTSGALLGAEVSAAAKRIFGIAPREIFGSTETGGVAWRRQGGAAAEFDWNVLPAVKIARSPEGRLQVFSPYSYKRGYVMGDGVEIAPDARRFRLLGRMDRMVKIAEQRVSLPEMEEKMARLPEVEEAALAVLPGKHGDVLGAVVKYNPAALAGAGGAPRSKRELAMALRKKLLEFFPSGAAPRRYRFVAELPRNAQGKVRTGEIRKILAGKFTEPWVLAADKTETGWRLDLVFDGEAEYFDGHFENFPVLPGVVQLGMAIHLAGALGSAALTAKCVRRLKFANMIRPGAKVALELSMRDGGVLEFRYSGADGALHSSGLVDIETVG